MRFEHWYKEARRWLSRAIKGKGAKDTAVPPGHRARNGQVMKFDWVAELGPALPCTRLSGGNGMCVQISRSSEANRRSGSSARQWDMPTNIVYAGSKSAFL